MFSIDNSKEMNKIKQFLEAGEIVTTHGLKGEVKVYPLCDDIGIFEELEAVYFDGGKKSIEIENAKFLKKMVVLKLKGIDTVEQAVTLRKKFIYIDRNDIELDEREFFVQDLIGLDVIDVDTGFTYGKLVDVSQTGANDIYHVKSSENKMYYIPAIKQVVINTDLEKNHMLIRPLKGLFDDEN